MAHKRTDASEPLVSVVTPVYNEAEHLSECIESVLAQTYRNWDYTVVDNCSTDGTAEIVRRYAARDPRIRLVQNQRFLRAIPNHNVAFRQISPASKYCKVVFGDDWLFPECLERMVGLAECHPAVGIVSAYALEGHDVRWTGLPYPSSLVGGRDICRRHFLNKLYVFGTATTVLYRADLVRCRDPFYTESNIHADTEVCFALLANSDFGFVHQVLTFTRARPGTLSSVSANLQTHFASTLRHLQTYGPDYLSTSELDSCLKRHLMAYYRFLGKSLLFSHDAKFWDFHKTKLIEAGVGFSRMRLLTSLLTELAGAALNPKRAIGRLMTRKASA